MIPVLFNKEVTKLAFGGEAYDITVNNCQKFLNISESGCVPVAYLHCSCLSVHSQAQRMDRDLCDREKITMLTAFTKNCPVILSFWSSPKSASLVHWVAHGHDVLTDQRVYSLTSCQIPKSPPGLDWYRIINAFNINPTVNMAV